MKFTTIAVLAALGFALSANLAKAQEASPSPTPDTRTDQTDIHSDGSGRAYVPGPVVSPELTAVPDTFIRFKPIAQHFNNNSLSLQADPGKANTAKIQYSRVLGRPELFDGKASIEAGAGLLQNGLSLNLAARRLFNDDSKSRFFYDAGVVLSFDVVKNNAIGAEDTSKHLLTNFGPEFRAGYNLNDRLALIVGVNPKITKDFSDSSLDGYGFGVSTTLSWTGAKSKKRPNPKVKGVTDKNEDHYEPAEFIPGDDTINKIYQDPSLWSDAPHDRGSDPTPDAFDDDGKARSIGSDSDQAPETKAVPGSDWDGSGQDIDN